MEAPAVLVRGLRKSFGGTPVLRGVDLEVLAGGLTAVLGPSGCGKTTLLRLIAGFERADGGSVALGGKVLEDERTHLAPERRKVGLVPQEGALFPQLDVRANVGFGLSRSERRGGRVEDLLELVGLTELDARHPHQLSGGQQQRVSLARALAPRPSVVLLDEPFDALDAGLRAQVRSEVRLALRASGTTALLVTHDQEEALSLADRVALMRDGRIVQSGDPEDLYRDPVDPAAARFLGEAVVLDGRLVAAGSAETALGPVAVRGAHGEVGGRVTLMLRPEQIVLREDGEGASGRVVSSEFFGHDATARIRLDGAPDLEVSVRAAGGRLPIAGAAVRLDVTGSALAFEGEGVPDDVAASAVPR